MIILKNSKVSILRPQDIVLIDKEDGIVELVDRIKPSYELQITLVNGLVQKIKYDTKVERDEDYERILQYGRIE